MWWAVVASAEVPVPPLSDGCVLSRVEIAVRHESNDATVAREARLAELQFRDPEVVPSGGWVYVSVSAQTFDEALAHRLTVVVHDATGGEVLRVTGGRWPLPDLNDADPRFWGNAFAAPVLVPVEYPLLVHVIDDVEMERCTWRMEHSGASALTEGRSVLDALEEIAQIEAPPPPPLPPLFPCEIDTFSATMTNVVINGDWHTVVGSPAWTAVASRLDECGFHRAATDLIQWRTNRRATNVLAGAGCALLGVHRGTRSSRYTRRSSTCRPASRPGGPRGRLRQREGPLLRTRRGRHVPTGPVPVLQPSRTVSSETRSVESGR